MLIRNTSKSEYTITESSWLINQHQESNSHSFLSSLNHRNSCQLLMGSPDHEDNNWSFLDCLDHKNSSHFLLSSPDHPGLHIMQVLPTGMTPKANGTSKLSWRLK